MTNLGNILDIIKWVEEMLSMGEDKIYVIYSGSFGEQMVNNLATKGFADKIVEVFELKPETIEEEHPSEKDLWGKVWEDPEKYLPKGMPIKKCDLLLVLGIHPKLGDLIPPIAQKLGAKAVLYPIDDKKHVPEAKRTIEEDLKTKNIHVEFPEPFCYLDRSGNGVINQFAEHFGEPKFEVELDEEKEVIKSIEILRDTPCGTASAVTEKLVGFPYRNIKALKEKIQSEHRNEKNEYHCMAEINPLNPYLQKSGDKLVEKFFEACRKVIRDPALFEEFYPV